MVVFLFMAVKVTEPWEDGSIQSVDHIVIFKVEADQIIEIKRGVRI